MRAEASARTEFTLESGEAPSSAPKRISPFSLLSTIVVGGALALGVVLRFRSPPGLWLDEALSVNIAELPLGRIPEALRHDGSPPLYYILLHFWIRLFGHGDTAVRALSAAFSVASLPLAFIAGRRLGGGRVAWTAVLLLASSPFAVRYASETRMYSLIVLLIFVGFLALWEALVRPGILSLMAVAIAGGLLLLTHYWAFPLLAAVLCGLVVRMWRSTGQERAAARLAVLAVCSSGLLFAPWIPSLFEQLRSTGTPWGSPARFVGIYDVLADFSGGSDEPGRLLLFLLVGLAILGVFGRAVDARRIEIDLRSNPIGRALAVGALGSLVIGILASVLLDNTFTSRYAAVSVVPFVLLVAVGTIAFSHRVAHLAVVGLVVTLGFHGAWEVTNQNRTQARAIAAELERTAADGDLIAYCPDQLGPAVSRHLSGRFRQVTFPRATGPEFVDWKDYQDQPSRTDPTAFAEMLDREAGSGNDLWMVWTPGYILFEDYCDEIDVDLGALRRGATTVISKDSRRYGESANLVRYPKGCRRPLRERDQEASCAPESGRRSSTRAPDG